MVTYLDGLLPIKSRDPYITWTCNITWQTKVTISPLLSSLTLKDSYPCYSTLWSCDLARSCNQLKLLYLHLHDAYGHQIWQAGRGITYHEGIPPINSYDPFAHVALLVTWQTKTIVSPPPICLSPQNLIQCWLE